MILNLHYVQKVAFEFGIFWLNGYFNIYSCYYLPLEKDVPYHLNKLKSPTPKGIPNLAKTGSVVLEKSKM
jgi:hypothetical protein